MGLSGKSWSDSSRFRIGSTFSHDQSGLPAATQLSMSAFMGRGAAMTFTDEPPPMILPASL